MRQVIDQQLRSNDCGISAVKTVCNLLEVPLSRRQIEENVVLDQHGASLESINKFFRDSGFETKYKMLDLNSINGNETELQELFPCITPIKSKRGLHYVVLDGLKNKRFKVLDPATVRRYYLSVQEFKKKAYFSKSHLEYAELDDILLLKISEEIKHYPVSIPEGLAGKDLLDVFNKLTYFSYIRKNFGFRDEEAGAAFLQDLLYNQNLPALPQHFRTMQLEDNGTVEIKAPILLSIHKKETTKVFEQEKEQNIYLRLIRSIKGIRGFWSIFILTTFIAAGISYIAVFINQILIDHILPTYQLDVLVLFAIGVGVFYIFNLIFTVYKRFISIHLGLMLDRFFLSVYDQKLNNFSIRYLQSFRRGDLTERLGDAMKIKSFFLTFFSKIFVNMVIAVFSIGILVVINWKLSLLVFMVLAVFMGLFFAFTPTIKRLEQQRFAKKADFFSKFIEKIDGIQSIKALRLEAYSSAIIQSHISSLIEVYKKSRYVGLLNSTLTSLIVSFSTLGIIVLTSRAMIVDNAITLGMIITYVALSRKIFRAFRSLLDYNLDLQEHQVILNRFFDFEEKLSLNGVGNPSMTTTPKIEELKFKSLSLQDVAFGYQEDKTVLSGVTFSIKKGEKIWIQGKNGSGKSTLCRIIGMLYPPTGGDLLVNDISMDHYKDSVLKKSIILVSNEDIIFNDTLLFNITFGRNIQMEKMINLAKKLNFFDFINGLPDKFDYVLHENGRNLSMGQRKKVLLLRALMSDSELIILDEIFNGIDAESKLQSEGLINEMKEKTFIVISHMPVEQIEFDKKYKLTNGKLVDQTTQSVLSN